MGISKMWDENPVVKQCIVPLTNALIKSNDPSIVEYYDCFIE